MDTPKNTRASGLGSALIMATALIALPAFATDDTDNGPRNRTVNCHSDDASIQRQIDEIRPGRKAIIFINGQCDEDVLIEKDDITLSGNKDGDGTIDGGVTGTITVVGARRVTIEYLHVTGRNQGIRALDGASVKILHNEIIDNEGDGIGAFNNAFVLANFNTITDNGRLKELEAGIDAGHNSAVRSQGNYIAENGFAAIEVGNASYWRSEGGDQIFQKGCSEGQTSESDCGDPKTIAVDCFRNGSCHVRGATIIGSSFISGMSFFDVRQSTINGSVGAAGGSGVRFREEVTGPGGIDCFSFAFAFDSVSCFVPDPETE